MLARRWFGDNAGVSRTPQYLICCLLLTLAWAIPSRQAAGQDVDTSKWKTFANRAGWSIKHPSDWKVGSCNSCSDPTDPYVFVSLYHPSDNALMMVQHLIDKPENQTVRQWLDDLKSTANLNPRISEEWITLDGQPALKVITSNPDNTQGEDIYVVYGDRTFYVSFERNTPSDAIFRQMLITFRFAKSK
jgi:hypothetical protein